MSVDGEELQEEQHNAVVVNFVCFDEPNRVHLFKSISLLLRLVLHLISDSLLVSLMQIPDAFSLEVKD